MRNLELTNVSRRVVSKVKVDVPATPAAGARTFRRPFFLCSDDDDGIGETGLTERALLRWVTTPQNVEKMGSFGLTRHYHRPADNVDHTN